MAAADASSPCFENYILADVGCNLTNKKFSRDLESVISRAKDAGVCKIIVTGSSIRGSKEALRLARFHPGTIYSTAGVHPHDGKSWTDTSLAELSEIACASECVGIGVCGLDYTKNYTEPDVQRSVFRYQVELASKLKKPLIVTERSAHEDFINIIKEYEARLPYIVLHSYSGSIEHTQIYLQMDMYFCITGLISKASSDNGLLTLLKGGNVPLHRLLVQSDSPFLYPNARGKNLPDNIKEALTERSLTFLQRYCTFQRNEPCSLPIIVEMVAAFLEKPAEDFALGTTLNALKIFSLD